MPGTNVQFLSFSCSFRQKSCQLIGFCSKFRGWRPDLGNPGLESSVVMEAGIRTGSRFGFREPVWRLRVPDNFVMRPIFLLCVMNIVYTPYFFDMHHSFFVMHWHTTKLQVKIPGGATIFNVTLIEFFTR